MTKRTWRVLAVLLVPLSACNQESGEDPVPLVQRPVVSECGGFFASLKSPLGSPETYCEAERLEWAYDAEAGTLALADNRALLNCCGNHSLVVALEEGVYVVRETDAPEAAGSRCDCMCVFDYAVEIDDVPAGRIDLRLERHVTDETEAFVEIWSGPIDLSLGLGSIVIDATDVEPWCSGAMPD